MALASDDTNDFGSDLSCIDDLSPSMAEVSFTHLVLQEALARRLTTPRGFIIDDPLYGYDVRGWLNNATDNKTIARIRGEIRGELMKDERVLSANVAVTVSGNPGSLTMLIQCEGDSIAGPYNLVVSVDRVNVELLAEGTA